MDNHILIEFDLDKIFRQALEFMVDYGKQAGIDNVLDFDDSLDGMIDSAVDESIDMFATELLEPIRQRVIESICAVHLNLVKYLIIKAVEDENVCSTD